MDWTQVFVDDGTQTHALLQSRVSRLLGGSYGAKVAYCFCLNYMLGVGALGIPNAFVKGGVVLSSAIMILVTLVSIITVVWMAEVCARAQAPECREEEPEERTRLVSEASSFLGHSYQSPTTPLSGSRYRNPAARPSFSLRNQYEVTELCDFFLGYRGKYFYQIALMFLMYTGLWAYSSVFLTSVAEMFPLSFLCKHCDVEELSIYVYAVLFASIAVPLSCVDLTEQISIQVVLTLARFLTFFTMIGSCLYGIFADPYDAFPPRESTAKAPYTADFSLFNFSHFGVVFTTSVFSLLFQHSVPGLIHPIKDKRKVLRVLISAIVSTSALYICLGSLCAIYFGSSVKESVNLNWKSFSFGVDRITSSAVQIWAIELLRYIVVLFPAVDVLSVFPLIAITLGNSLEYTWKTLMFGKIEQSRSDELELCSCSHKYFRVLAALPPIIGCLLYRKLAFSKSCSIEVFVVEVVLYSSNSF